MPPKKMEPPTDTGLWPGRRKAGADDKPVERSFAQGFTVRPLEPPLYPRERLTSR